MELLNNPVRYPIISLAWHKGKNFQFAKFDGGPVHLCNIVNDDLMIRNQSNLVTKYKNPGLV